MSGLTEDVIEIPIAGMNQQPAKNAGPLGRLLEAKQSIVTKYNDGQGGPERLRLEQRGAFVSLSTDTRSPIDGSATDTEWTNPEMLATLGDQPISICNSVPRVYNGEDAFVAYDDKRTVVNRLSSDVFHTSEHTIQVDDSASIANVTCCVWTETTLIENVPKTATFIGFRGANKAWLITPKVLFDPGEVTISSNVAMARVVIDGDGERFWVVFNAYVDDFDRELRIQTYDTAGRLLSSSSIEQFAPDPGPGFWDIAPRAVGGIFIAQPGAEPDGTTDVHVETTTAELNGVTIDIFQEVDTTIKCSGPLAYITNNADSLNYLATHLNNDGHFVYQMTEFEQTHEFAIGGSEDDPDSFVGWVEPNQLINPDPPPTFLQEPKVYLAWTTLSDGSASAGPAFDPALRYTEVWSCTWAGSGVKIRQINSVCLVSRAFEHNGEYYAMTYYQSGSGLAITQTATPVTWTAGDYMIGPSVQPLPVAPGDSCFGSPSSFATTQTQTVPYAAQNIDDTGTPDNVSVTTAGAAGLFAPPDMPVLRWEFKNMNVVAPIPSLGQMRITGSSIASANKSWWYIAGTGSVLYTEVGSVGNGTSVVPGNFVGAGGGGGTVQIDSVTHYDWAQMMDVYSEDTVSFLNGGTIEITGDLVDPGNNGTFTIARALRRVPYYPFNGGMYVTTITVLTTTQASINSPSVSAIAAPISAQRWLFAGGNFTDVLSEVPHELLVSNSTFDLNGNLRDNDGEHAITDVPSPTLLETDGDMLPQIFAAPLPTISITHGLAIADFTFNLQSVVLDYSLQGALILVQNSPIETNNGLYKIRDINVADGLIYAEPADGHTGQFSESFLSDVSITIFVNNNISPVFQPRWFMTPLAGTDTAQAGRFEDGLAYADWRIEGDSDIPANIFLMGITSVVATPSAKQFTLPYRARSFTAGQPLVAPPNQVAEGSVTVFESTVGLKTFTLENACGFSTPLTGELLIPGPLTGVFTSSGFREQGINVGPEAPFVVSQQEADGDVHLTPGTQAQYVVTFEVTDENGDRVFCPPSAALDVKLTGDNNQNTIGGRLPLPLGTGGLPVDDTYGLTNHRIVGICVTRTAHRGGVPTIQHFKITNDLNVNGLAPVSDLNESGFEFPDEFTWQYTDSNPDVSILSNEILYTDKGYLPRFPAVASQNGCIWQRRPWIIAYDGSLQFGGEKSEGDSSWFFPGFRYTFGNDKAVACAPMGNNLIVGCRESVWYIPAPNSFPDAAGRNGTMPAAVEIVSVKNGCLSQMIAIDGGVAYDSTLGGIWAITVNFDNVWLSRDISNDLKLGGDSVTAMTIDDKARIVVATGTTRMYAYDQIVKTWYKWTFPTPTAEFLTVIDGNVAVQDNHRVSLYDPDSYVDNIEDVETPIAWDITFADFTFGNSRHVKQCWALQYVGEYFGPHRVGSVLTYPQDTEPTTVYAPETPDPSLPYLAEINPQREDASTFGLRIYTDFEGVETPGRSSAIELISAAVGIGYGQAQTDRRLL